MPTIRTFQVDSLQDKRAFAGKGASLSITVLSPSDPSPTACAVFIVSATVVVFLDVRARIDIDTEIQNLGPRQTRLPMPRRRLINAPDFADKYT